MSKNQPPYIPYRTSNGNYTVNIAVVTNSKGADLDEQVRVVNPIVDGSDPNDTVSRGDLYKIAAATLLCTYHGKDFYDLLVTGANRKQIQNKFSDGNKSFTSGLEQPNFPAYPNSVYWHINQEELILNTDYALEMAQNIASEDIVTIKDLGIDTKLTKAYRVNTNDTPGVSKKRSVRIYQIIYFKQAFDSLNNMNFVNEAEYRLYNELSDITPIGETELVFQNYKDFEKSMDSLSNLLKYYQHIQEETFLEISDNTLPVEFNSLMELVNSFKQNVKEHIEINNIKPSAIGKFELRPTISPSGEYYIGNPALITGRSEDTAKKLKNDPEDQVVMNVAIQEYAKNELFKGYTVPEHIAGIDAVNQQLSQDDLLDLATTSTFTKEQANVIYSTAVYNDVIKAYITSGAQKGYDWINRILTLSNVDLFGIDDFSEVIVSALPLKDVDPKLVLLLKNLKHLISLAGKTFDSEESCVDSFTAKARSAKRASKLLSSTSTMTPEELTAGTDVDTSQDALDSNPPDILQFSKRYIEYPRKDDGTYNTPTGIDAPSYTGITTSLSDNLSNDQKVKIINAARNQPSKPKFKEVVNEILTPDGIELKRRAASLEVSGVSFFNDEGDFDFDFDIRNTMARRNRTFADQVGDEIFKVTPRTPAKIRDIDDAYRFFLSKLDLSSIAREALKCTFLKYSVDDIIEYLCDSLLENFFSAFGTDTDEVVKFINNVKTRQYKALGIDLTFSVQQALSDIEKEFEKWAVEQNTTLHTNIAGETVENAQDLSKPPPLGSESFYSTIREGFDGSTKRALCELLIAGGVALTNALIKLYEEASGPNLDKRLEKGAELKLKSCEDNFSFDIPDNLPNWSRILQDITAQIERVLRDYAEQFIINPLREALLNILSCGEEDGNSPPVGQFDLSGISGGLDAEVFMLLKAYVGDVFSSLNTDGVCSLLRGVPSDQTIGVCNFILGLKKYANPKLQSILRTKSQKISTFKRLGTEENLKACDAVDTIRETADLCNDYSKVKDNLTRILRDLGLSDEEIKSQLSVAGNVNRENFKGIINSIFGDPSNLLSASEIANIVSDSDGFQKINAKALTQILDPVEDNIEQFGYDNFKEEYNRAVIRTQLDSLPGDAGDSSTPKGFLAALAAKDPYEAAAKYDILGLYDPNNPDQAADDGVKVTTTNTKMKIGDFEYSEPNLFGDSSRAAKTIKELSKIEELFSLHYSSIPADIIEYFDQDGENNFNDIFVKAIEDIHEIIAQEIPEDSDKSKVSGLTSIPYSDLILNLKELKKVISRLSSQNFSDLPMDPDVPPTHLYDALYEGVVVLYTRIFLVELVLNSPYLYEVFNPEYVMDSESVKRYVREVMYPEMGTEFSKITDQLEKISKTYLKDKSDVNINYKASLNKLNELVSEMFNKVEKKICDEDNQNNLALPVSFENSNKLFSYVDAGDAMVYNNVLSDNDANEMFFENYVSFDKVNTEKLTPSQIEKLQLLGILNVDVAQKQIISEKELFAAYKILFDGTNVSDFKKKNLLPMGFYVKDDKNAEFDVVLEQKDDSNTMYYSPNYQTYKMMHGFVAEKYFKTAVLQFADGNPTPKTYSNESSWPQKWWDSGAGDASLQQLKSSTDVLTQTLLTSLKDPLENEFGIALTLQGYTREQVINNINNLVIPLNDYASVSDFNNIDNIVISAWENNIQNIQDMEDDQEGNVRSVLKLVDEEFFPGAASDEGLQYVKRQTLEDEDWVFETSGPYRDKFEQYYGDSFWTSAVDGTAGGIQPKDNKIKDMFFPNYYRKDDGNLAVFNSEKYFDDPDLILQGSFPSGEQAMTANPVYVEDYTNEYFYGNGGLEGTSNYRESKLATKKTSAGVSGRVIGKFYFNEPNPAAIKYFDGEQAETKQLSQGETLKFNLLTRDTFIEKFNNYQSIVNPIYQDLRQSVDSLASTYINKPEANLNVPDNIIQLEKVGNTNYLRAVDSSGDEKSLYFEEINIRVPIRMTVEKGKADGDIFSSDEYTKTKNGITYQDDGNTLGFIYTKPITVVRVYYVEELGQDFLNEDEEYYTAFNGLTSTNGQITEETRVCEIFENFKYGMRASFNIYTETVSAGSAEHKIFQYLSNLISFGDISPLLYYYQKQYLSKIRKGDFSGLANFADAFQNPEILGGNIFDKNLGGAVVLPLVSSELTFSDIKNDEDAQFPFSGDRLKDVFKNFPCHKDQSLTSPAHEYVSTEKLYGAIAGNNLFCNINRDKKLRDFFRCGMKIQNFLSFITLQTKSKVQKSYTTYGIDTQFKTTKDTIQKLTDTIIRDRDGDDI